MIKGLHHNAYRCRDSEETRIFYEDFLGLPLVSAFEIDAAAAGPNSRALHTFFQMDDGSCLAFFEVPGSPFDFKTRLWPYPSLKATINLEYYRLL